MVSIVPSQRKTHPVRKKRNRLDAILPSYPVASQQCGVVSGPDCCTKKHYRRCKCAIETCTVPRLFVPSLLTLPRLKTHQYYYYNQHTNALVILTHVNALWYHISTMIAIPLNPLPRQLGHRYGLPQDGAFAKRFSLLRSREVRR